MTILTDTAFPARTAGDGPHAGRRLAASGPSPARARLAMVILHGRGGRPEDMLGLERVVHRSAELLVAMGASVAEHVIPGAGHGIVAEEATWLRARINGGPQIRSAPMPKQPHSSNNERTTR